jgi:hypothetical protein
MEAEPSTEVKAFHSFHFFKSQVVELTYADPALGIAEEVRFASFLNQSSKLRINLQHWEASIARTGVSP